MAKLRWGPWIVVLATFLTGCGGEPARETPSGASPAEIPQLRRAMEADPDNPARVRPLAIALFDSGLREEAVELFEKAVELDTNVRSLLDLALGYGNVSRLPEAEATYQRLLELSPEHPIALHNLGNVALGQGDPDLAIEYYERATTVKPDYLLAYYHLGDALNTAGRYREAYATYGKAVELEPTNAQELEAFDSSLYGMAALDIKLGAHQRAAEILTTLLEENPDHPSAHYAYGQVLLQLGRPDEARRELETHMRILAEIEPTAPMAAGR